MLEVASERLHYWDVAASQTAAALGVGGGRAGDYISHILVVPETTGAGTIALLDLATSRNVFVAGTLADLKPFVIPVGAYSGNGAWKITTGANVHIMAFGRFS